MKTEGQVRHKLQQVTFRHLQREIRTKLSRRPDNCINNRRVKLSVLTTRFCTLHEDESGAFLSCDEACGGLELAAKCPEFECANTKENVREDLTNFLKSSDVPTIAAEYPDVAALLWTLDANDRPLPAEEDPDPAPRAPPYQILYLLPEGGASVTYPMAPTHRAILYYNSMLPPKGEP